VDLPAFLLSKNFYSESIGMPRSAVLTAALENSTILRSPFQLDRLAVTPNELARDLSGGTYLIVLHDLAFQLCLPQLPLKLFPRGLLTFNR
jgi:hypothetical protein